MKRSIRVLCVAAALLAVSGILSGQSEPDPVDKASREFEVMVREVNAFVGDVRFDEGDVKSLIDHWPELSALEPMMADSDEDETFDFKGVLTDPTYRSWAASNGLDADDWLRKSTRIMMALFREQLLESAAMMPHHMQQQMEMIEEQRAQVGEEMYQQMKEAMEAGAEINKRMETAARELPQPTPAEQAALDAHRDELVPLMHGDDDDDWDDEYGDDDAEYGDEEDDDWR
jgi:hypothetical protein